MIGIGFNIMSHKGEIEIMDLIGSPAKYIKIPFLLEGAYYGVIGAIISASLIIIPWYSIMYVTKGSDFSFWITSMLNELSLNYLITINPLFISLFYLFFISFFFKTTFPPAFSIFLMAELDAAFAFIMNLPFISPLPKIFISFKSSSIPSLVFLNLPSLMYFPVFSLIMPTFITSRALLFLRSFLLLPKYSTPFLSISVFFWSALFPVPAIPFPPWLPFPLCFLRAPYPHVFLPLILLFLFLFLIFILNSKDAP